MVMLHNLPDRQRQVLHYIDICIDEKKQSPTILEIATHIDISEQHVRNVLKALEGKGRIKRDKNQHRSITIIE